MTKIWEKLKKKAFISLVTALLLLSVIVFPAGAKCLFIDDIKEPVISGDKIKFTGITSVSPEKELKWSFGTENYVYEEYFKISDGEDFRYYKEGTTKTLESKTGLFRYEVFIDTNDLEQGYYNFQIAGGDCYAEASVRIGDEINDGIETPEYFPSADFYKSPNSKIITDKKTSGLRKFAQAQMNERDFIPSPYIYSKNTVVRGNNIDISFFTTPYRNIGLWIYSVFPDNSYRYFRLTSSDVITGKADISFGPDVTSNLKKGEYYIFAEISGLNHLEAEKFDFRDSTYRYLPVTPDSGGENSLYSDVSGNDIYSPASSVALDSALKASEDEMKYLRLKINVEDPWINLEKSDEIAIGKNIIISGKTNFEEGTTLLAEIISLDDRPDTGPVVWTAKIPVSTGTDGEENFRIEVNSYKIGAGTYIVRVSDEKYKLTEDNEIIKVTDNSYAAEEGESDTLSVKSYSVDPISKKVVRLNDDAKESPVNIFLLVFITGLIVFISVLIKRRKSP
ncbi:hypothetical protein L1994_10070 [Methanomicrobium antiquum]|uniref:Uncharacterized protein n=1 Tax=Methanomicrobium antiquum TaxID=487686 RepID=A0AAF0JLV3_9EURY|nr:hypothetical protein [Methanomicrobium antiquum]WFN36477.1 hypothetical protein L1994_10070 [Methanomicrobium antiquum]